VNSIMQIDQQELDRIDKLTIDQKLEEIRIAKFYDTVDKIALLLQTDEELKAFYDKLGSDLVYFTKVVRGDICKGEVPEHHKNIFRFLKGSETFKALVCFRSAGKTFCKTTMLLQDICHMKEAVIYMISDTEGQAIKDLIEIKQEIEANEVLRYIYGDLKGKAPWGVTQIECANGVYVSVRGTGSAIRGTKWKNTRLTKVVMDDFESEQNCNSQDKRERLQDWIDAQVIPAGGELGTYSVVFFGTIVNEEAMLAKANPKIDEKSLFQGNLGAFLQVDITYKNDKDEDIPSWPEVRGWDFINHMKSYYEQRKRLWFFYQEYYNIPATMSNPVFKMEMIPEINASIKRFSKFTWIEVYEETDVLRQGKHIDIPLNVYVGVDPSIVASADSDDTVLFTIGLTPKGKYVILDIVSNKIPIEEQADFVLDHMDKWHPTHTTIETYAYQLVLYEYVLKGIRNGRTPHVVFPFKENKNKSTKYKEGLIEPINNGMVSFVKGCSNIDKFKEQGRKFSGGVTEHDDTLDGMFLAICEDREKGRVLFPPYDVLVSDRLIKLRAIQKKKELKASRKRTKNFMAR